MSQSKRTSTSGNKDMKWFLVEWNVLFVYGDPEGSTVVSAFDEAGAQKMIYDSVQYITSRQGGEFRCVVEDVSDIYEPLTDMNRTDQVRTIRVLKAIVNRDDE